MHQMKRRTPKLLDLKRILVLFQKRRRPANFKKSLDVRLEQTKVWLNQNWIWKWTQERGEQQQRGEESDVKIKDWIISCVKNECDLKLELNCNVYVI